ncbi:MAG: hypothetical protein ABMA64_30915 [Myxococcota bacterium]
MRVWFGGLWLGATGCEAQVCGLLGSYDGEFEGDLAGTVAAAISEDPKDPTARAIASFVLETADTQLEGNGYAQCDSGELTLDLTDLEGTQVGDVLGALTDGEGHGDWSLFDGRGGTWFY